MRVVWALGSIPAHESPHTELQVGAHVARTEPGGALERLERLVDPSQPAEHDAAVQVRFAVHRVARHGRIEVDEGIVQSTRADLE